jgi:asparagine synthetase B (glutamine-hydrolysing)
MRTTSGHDEDSEAEHEDNKRKQMRKTMRKKMRKRMRKDKNFMSFFSFSLA